MMLYKCEACRYEYNLVLAIEAKQMIDHWVCQDCYFRTLSTRTKVREGMKQMADDM